MLICRCSVLDLISKRMIFLSVVLIVLVYTIGGYKIVVVFARDQLYVQIILLSTMRSVAHL